MKMAHKLFDFLIPAGSCYRKLPAGIRKVTTPSTLSLPGIGITNRHISNKWQADEVTPLIDF